jgi:hypothetical protein
VEEVHSYGSCCGVRSVGELPSEDGVVESSSWRGEANVKVGSQTVHETAMSWRKLAGADNGPGDDVD